MNIRCRFNLIESDSSAAPSFTLGLQHSDAISSSTPDECAYIPADSIAGDEIAKVTDSIASPARASNGTKPILSVTHTLTLVTQAAYSNRFYFIANKRRYEP